MYSDEDCEDDMRFIISNKDELKLDNLTFDDMDLLEEYAPKLFNTYDGKNLEQVMLNLAIKLHNYRTDILSGEIGKELDGAFYPEVMSHKTDKVKQDTLAKYSKAIINLIFEKEAGTDKGLELVNKLYDVIKKPEDYLLLKSPIFYPSKKRIKEYLYALKLRGKTTEINNFINAIKN